MNRLLNKTENLRLWEGLLLVELQTEHVTLKRNAELSAY